MTSRGSKRVAEAKGAFDQGALRSTASSILTDSKALLSDDLLSENLDLNVTSGMLLSTERYSGWDFHCHSSFLIAEMDDGDDYWRTE